MYILTNLSEPSSFNNFSIKNQHFLNPATQTNHTDLQIPQKICSKKSLFNINKSRTFSGLNKRKTIIVLVFFVKIYGQLLTLHNRTGCKASPFCSIPESFNYFMLNNTKSIFCFVWSFLVLR